MEDTRVSKMSKWEIVTIVFESLLGLAGLIFIVLGFISSYLPVKNSENWTGEAAFQAVMKLDYRVFGAILLVGAALIAAFFLNFFARKSDVDTERAQRRAQRLKILAASEAVPETPKEPAPAETVEVKASPKGE